MASLYRVGITLLLTDGVTPGLSRISHQLLGVHASATQINNQFGKWAMAIGGAGAVMAGSALLKGMGKVASHGKELLDQQDKLIRAGRTQAEVANLTAEAYAKITKAVPTAKASDVLRTQNEMSQITGNFHNDPAVIEKSLKLEALLANATGKSASGQGFSMYRALEEKLVTTDAALTDKFLNVMLQGTIGSGGRVTGSNWQTFARRAGVAWIKADEQFVGSIAPTLINSLGADTAGTALMTMYQTVMGAGTLSKQQYEAFNRLHLIDPSKVTVDKGGRVNVGAGGIIGSTESKGNLMEWGRKYLAPSLEQYVPEAERDHVLSKIGRNRNTTRMFETFTNPLGIAQFDKDSVLYKKTLGLDDAYKNYTTQNPKGVEEAFHSQYKSMMEAIGGPLMKTAMPVMVAITDLFNSLAQFANSNPETIKVIGIGIAGLGAALVGAGAVALLAAIGPAGWLIGGIVALGAAVAAIRGGAVADPEGTSWWNSHSIQNWMSGKDGKSAVPPSKSGEKSEGGGDVYLDGKKVGEIVTKHQSQAASGPVGGSAYFDGTAALIPQDYAMGNG